MEGGLVELDAVVLYGLVHQLVHAQSLANEEVALQYGVGLWIKVIVIRRQAYLLILEVYALCR